MLMGTSAPASVFTTYKSESRTDIALLGAALFMQRFTLPFFHTLLSIDLVVAVLIIVHRFASGRLFIQYDRLLWFVPVVLFATFSLVSNFENKMLTSYGLFISLYFLFTF